MVVGPAKESKFGEMDVLSSINAFAPDVALFLPEKGAATGLSGTSVEPDADFSSELIDPEEVGLSVSVDLG